MFINICTRDSNNFYVDFRAWYIFLFRVWKTSFFYFYFTDTFYLPMICYSFWDLNHLVYVPRVTSHTFFTLPICSGRYVYSVANSVQAFVTATNQDTLYAHCTDSDSNDELNKQAVSFKLNDLYKNIALYIFFQN